MMTNFGTGQKQKGGMTKFRSSRIFRSLGVEDSVKA